MSGRLPFWGSGCGLPFGVMLLAAVGANAGRAEAVNLTSPDGRLEALIGVDAAGPSYTLRWRGRDLIARSRLGIDVVAERQAPGWRVVDADSEAEGYPPSSAVDGDPGSFWHTRFMPDADPMPHHLVIDLGQSRRLRGVSVLPRQDKDNGRIAGYEVYVAEAMGDWGEAVASGNWPNQRARIPVPFPRLVEGRYVQLRILSEVRHRPFAALAEFDVMEGNEDDEASGQWRLTGRRSRHIDTIWRPVWGKRRQVHFRANELTLSLRRDSPSAQRLDVVFRASDDGLAFRYVVEPERHEPLSVSVTADRSEFNFAGDFQVWSYNGEHRPRGPERLSQWAGRRRWPLTIKAAEDTYLAVAEAALYDFASLDFSSAGGSTAVRAELGRSDVTAPCKTPWRVVIVGDSAGALIDTDLLGSLNPPCALEDTSWIKPGVAFWDWRAWGHQAGTFTYGLNMASWRRFVDLAAEAGIPYLLLDANWYGPEFNQSSDPVTAEQGADVRTLIKEARARGVGILLYLNDVAGRRYDLDTILQTYAKWGAAGVKYGFMRASGQEKVRRTRHIIELCAKHRLVCDFHDGPVPPSGDERTWPNCLTREYCHSQSDGKRVFTPETFCLQVYVNMVAGPIDMCNGMFDLQHSLAQRPKMFQQLDSTIIAELARTLIVYSGLTVVPDSADMYRQHAPLLEFIAAQRQPWDDSRTLAGELGDYIVTMRRSGETFLVAAATDEHERRLSVPLDFLGPGHYQCTLYEDAPDAHFQRRREAYRVRQRVVTAADRIELWMAPGGGHCMRLVPVTQAAGSR